MKFLDSILSIAFCVISLDVHASSTSRYGDWNERDMSEENPSYVRFSMAFEDCDLQRKISRYYAKKFNSMTLLNSLYENASLDRSKWVRQHHNHASDWFASVDLELNSGGQIKLYTPLIQARVAGQRIDLLTQSNLPWPPLTWKAGRLALRIAPQQWPIRCKVAINKLGKEGNVISVLKAQTLTLLPDYKGAPIVAYQFVITTVQEDPLTSELRLKLKHKHSS